VLSVVLECPDCLWRTTCGRDELARRLRTLGLLRRAKHPPDDLVSELLASNLQRLTCDHCGSTGLRIAVEEQEDAPGEWQAAVVCEVCHQPISPERLVALPTAKRCVACQEVADRGSATPEPEYCPKCGALLELRVSRTGGVTRYKQFCTGNPPCRL